MPDTQPSAPPAESPKPDLNELMQLPPMTRGEIGNLMACVDGVLRGQGLQVAETMLALAAKLAQAKPIPANRHERRAKGSK